MDAAEERFTALFDAHAPALLAYAVRRLVTPDDAADVVAETFLVAWRRLADVPPGDRARPWLFGVARNVLTNLHRGERRRLALADRLRAELSDVVAPELPDDTLARALDRLGDDDREVLRLSALEELAHDEIALVLGITRGAVRVRLHRARRRLTAAMAELAAADERGTERRRLPRTGQVIGGRVLRPGDQEA